MLSCTLIMVKLGISPKMVHGLISLKSRAAIDRAGCLRITFKFLLRILNDLVKQKTADVAVPVGPPSDFEYFSIRKLGNRSGRDHLL